MPDVGPDETDVRDRGRAHLLDAVVARRVGEILEEPFASPEHDWDDGEVQLVDEAGAQVLLDGGRAAPEPHVLPACGGEPGSRTWWVRTKTGLGNSERMSRSSVRLRLFVTCPGATARLVTEEQRR